MLSGFRVSVSVLLLLFGMSGRWQVMTFSPSFPQQQACLDLTFHEFRASKICRSMIFMQLRNVDWWIGRLWTCGMFCQGYLAWARLIFTVPTPTHKLLLLLLLSWLHRVSFFPGKKKPRKIIRVPPFYACMGVLDLHDIQMNLLNSQTKARMKGE